MATNLNIHQDFGQYDGTSRSFEEHVRPTEVPEPGEESAGYIEYLNDDEVLDAYVRAQRESPGALIYLEPHAGRRWSIQVYTSEAAKETFRMAFFYQCMARSRLSNRVR
jgi:hypothetical protein